MLSEIKLKCTFEHCAEIIAYDQYDRHKANCICNPDGIITCVYCKQQYLRKDKESHNKDCIKYVTLQNIELNNKMKEQKTKTTDLSKSNHKLSAKVKEIEKKLRAERNSVRSKNDELAIFKNKTDNLLQTNLELSEKVKEMQLINTNEGAEIIALRIQNADVWLLKSDNDNLIKYIKDNEDINEKLIMESNIMRSKNTELWRKVKDMELINTTLRTEMNLMRSKKDEVAQIKSKLQASLCSTFRYTVSRAIDTIFENFLKLIDKNKTKLGKFPYR